MTDTTALRWGLIGASDIAETRMIPTIRAIGQQVVALYSGSAEHAAAYAARNSIDHVSNSLDDLLRREDIDAVYISSFNERHREQVEAAARAGKHVLCEKPLAITVADAKAMLRACEAA